MPLNPQRTVDELKELRSLTGNEDGAQRVAWTDTWATARDYVSYARWHPVKKLAAGAVRGYCRVTLIVNGIIY